MGIIQSIELSEAIKWGNEAIDKMLYDDCLTVDHIDVRALHTLIVYANSVDYRTIAGGCLIVGGFLCAVLALSLGVVGAVFAIASKNVASNTVGAYALMFGVFAVLQFLITRLTRQHRS